MALWGHNLKCSICPDWVAQLVGTCPINQRVAGSIPGQSTYLGCGIGLRLGCVQKVTNQCFSFISMFLSSPLPFKNQQNISLGEDKKNKVQSFYQGSLCIVGPGFLTFTTISYGSQTFSVSHLFLWELAHSSREELFQMLHSSLQVSSFWSWALSFFLLCSPVPSSRCL